jgi:recombination protein RecT
MSLDEVNQIKARSSSVKFSKSGPWFTDFDEMAKKTVFRRCSKWLPLSPEQQKAFDFDNEDFSSEINDAVTRAMNDKFAQAVGETTIPAIPENIAIDAEIVEEPAPTAEERKEGLFEK